MLRQAPVYVLRRWMLMCVLVGTIVLAPAAHAATPGTLVRSLSDTALPTSSYPRSYHTMGTNVYFFAAGDVWKTDGTSTTLVKHFPLLYGLAGSYDADYALVSTSNLLFFAANDGVHGRELWKSDGTPGGTTLVIDLRVGPASGQIGALAVVNNQLVFRADDGVHGTQLWKSDGSAAGTQQITSDANNLRYPDMITATSGNCFAFVGTTNAEGSELWTSCGDTASTTLVKDIYAGSSSSSITNIVYANGAVYFSARDAANGYQLWKSDLTTAGTVRLSTGNGKNGIEPRDITATANVVVFSADDGTTGREPWYSNGTTDGTKILTDINPGGDGSDPRAFTPTATGVLFGADDGSHGSELWKSDGPGTTTLLQDINPGANGSDPSAFIKLPGENRWFFAADDGAHGKELWQTTAAAGSATLVQDIDPGAGSGLGAGYYSLLENNGAAALGARIFFTADNGSVGDEVFTATSTGGAALLRDIVPGNGGIQYQPLGSVGGRLFFGAGPQDPTLFYLPTPTQTLWRSDGDQASTIALHGFTPEDDGEPLTSNMITVGGTLYFSAHTPDTGLELWRSDGTAAGTALVADLEPGTAGSSPTNLANVNGTLYFTAYTSATKYKLWRLDVSGTPQVVAGFGSGTESAYADNMVVANGTLYFTGSTPATGNELWRIAADGTAQLVKDFCPGTCDGIFSYLELVVAGGVPYVTAYDGTSAINVWRIQADGSVTLLKDAAISSTISEFRIFDWNGALGFFRNETELWRSDGTPAGTAQVSTVSGLPTVFTVVGNKLFWSTDLALNVSDGTAAGTSTLLNKPFPGDVTSGDIAQLTAVGNRLVFTATTPTQGNELWSSDGTTTGTQPIELVPGETGALPLGLTVPIPGGKALFSAETPDAGRELWATDGTAAGTTRLTDIAPGAASSDPRDVALAGKRLFFQARDGNGDAGLYTVDRGAIQPYLTLIPLIQK